MLFVHILATKFGCKDTKKIAHTQIKVQFFSKKRIFRRMYLFIGMHSSEEIGDSEIREEYQQEGKDTKHMIDD